MRVEIYTKYSLGVLCFIYSFTFPTSLSFNSKLDFLAFSSFRFNMNETRSNNIAVWNSFSISNGVSNTIEFSKWGMLNFSFV